MAPLRSHHSPKPLPFFVPVVRSSKSFWTVAIRGTQMVYRSDLVKLYIQGFIFLRICMSVSFSILPARYRYKYR